MNDKIMKNKIIQSYRNLSIKYINNITYDNIYSNNINTNIFKNIIKQIKLIYFHQIRK